MGTCSRGRIARGFSIQILNVARLGEYQVQHKHGHKHGHIQYRILHMELQGHS